VAVLHGTGGVGKTQLALHCALQLEESGSSPYSVCWWVAAKQRDSLQQQHHTFATQAGIAVISRCDFDKLVSAVNSWLGSRHDWLLVFANVPSFDAVQDVIPPTVHPSQHVIITTRYTEWPAAYRQVPVDVMEAAEAVELLRAVAGIDGSDHTQDADITTLVAELGRLPLALSHAAAYIRQRRVTIRQYLDKCRLLLLDDRAKKPVGDSYHALVATTWAISIAAVDAACREERLPLLGRELLTQPTSMWTTCRCRCCCGMCWSQIY
jgi:hypothetical protein